MKNKFFLIAFVTICFATLSCQKDSIYSCDPEIVKWTKEHLNEISSMTRSDLIEYDDQTMKAIFGAMSPEQKYNVWMIKFSHLLQFHWNQEEKNHLLTMRSFITKNKNIFTNSKQDEDDHFLLFVYKWSEYAKDILGWDDQIISSLFNTPRDIIKTEKDGVMRISVLNSDKGLHWQTKVKTRSETGTDCDTNCNDTMNWCANRDTAMDCTSGGCTETPYCGWFWTQPCNGICHY